MSLLLVADGCAADGCAGHTSLSAEEQADLIPNLATKEELNEWERQNILQAYAWALDAGRRRQKHPATEQYLRDLHARMFGQTWKWAGSYRTTEKNLGVPHYQIRELLAVLLGDLRYWFEHRTYAADEISIRLHHRLVVIHPFPNGNGRHARLMADVLAQTQRRPAFTWGNADTMRSGDFRRRYIQALRAADNHNLQPLLEFARS